MHARSNSLPPSEQHDCNSWSGPVSVRRRPYRPLRGVGVDFSWHPWRALRVRYPEVAVSCRDRLPDRLMGLQQGHRIWLCRTLTQAERRCTLTHELVHRERGPVPHDLAEADREEQIVNEISARRLITLPSLVDGLRWTRDPRRRPLSASWACPPSATTSCSWG